MGLLDMLTNDGSTLTVYNGSTPGVNPLATAQSPLHADGDKPGYSLNGTNRSTVNAYYQAYLDGTNNILPQPSQLDINGATPARYLDNLPE